MANIPEIRFKGFAGAWEQRKLGEVAKYRNGKAHENEIDENGDYIVVNSKFISTDGEVRKRSNSQNEPLYENEIAFVLSDVPNGRAIARTFLVDKSEKYTLNQRIAGITPLAETYPYFLHVRMNRNSYFLRFDDGNKQTNLSIDDVMKYKDAYPSYNEQKKIGNYFKNLDNLITLHQRKCDEMSELKKYMLQKMLPDKEEQFPEIRFSGFTEPWRQRKLGEVVDVCSGRDYKHLDDGDIPVYGTGGYMLSVSEALSEKDDAIGIGRKGTIDNPYILRAPFWTVDTLFYCIPKENYNLDFFYSIYQNINWKALDESTGVPSLSKMAINNVDIIVPSKAEQEKIGAHFTQIDNLITHHQRKRDQLKELKKYMLQNMFPKKG